MSIPLARAADVRAMDRACIEGGYVPGPVLMERAGRAAARLALECALRDKPAVVLAGPGNNGGDGYVVAREMAAAGVRGTLWLTADPASLRGDARTAFLTVGDAWPVSILSEATRPDCLRALNEAGMIVDALFGTGLERPITGPVAEVLAAANATTAWRVALDIPSGIHADTGAVLGTAFAAHDTITFAALKPGLLLFPGASYAGRLTLADIGIPAPILAAHAAELRLVTPDTLRALLPARPADGHKGRFGHLLIAAGSETMPGAALLSTRAALRSGVGLVTLASTPKALQALAATLPEALQLDLADLSLPDALRSRQALAIGPGLGDDPVATALLAAWPELPASLPIVADADALRFLATHPLPHPRAALVLTPHPKEAARLLGTDVETVQGDRLAAARTLAERTGAVVLLKGAPTLVAEPGGPLHILPYGDTTLSKGGAGDVLTGLLGGLLAQGLNAAPAAILAAGLHGLAGETLGQRLGTRGGLAHELADELGPLTAAVEQGRVQPAQAALAVARVTSLDPQEMTPCASR